MKVGIIQMGRIGDMILITPLFAELKKIFPDSEIHVFAGPSNSSILVNNPNIYKVHTIEKSPIGIIKTITKLIFSHFDYWIDPKDHYSKESRYIARIVCAKMKIGFNKIGFKRIFDTDIPIGIETIHHSLISLKPLEIFDYKSPIVPPKPQLFLSEDSEIYVNKFLNSLDKKFVILNISGSMKHKMWGIENWTKFLKQTDIQFPIILCYAPSEKLLAKELLKARPELIAFKSRNIIDIVSLVSRSEFVMSPDTAIVHIAAAFNRPIFALYSGLDVFYNKFYPLSDVFTSVRAESGDNGITSISPDKAIAEFKDFLNLVKN